MFSLREGEVSLFDDASVSLSCLSAFVSAGAEVSAGRLCVSPVPLSEPSAGEVYAASSEAVPSPVPSWTALSVS